MKPLASATTSSRNWRHVTSVHRPSTLRRNATRSGSRSAFSYTMSATFDFGSTSTWVGTVYSRTWGSSSRFSHRNLTPGGYRQVAPPRPVCRGAPQRWDAWRVPHVDLIDETYVVADQDVLAERLRDPELWQRHWPGLELVVFMDRGRDGT